METKTEFITTLSQNPWLMVLSSFITIISFIAAIIFYYKARKVKDPKFEMRSINILKDSTKKISGLKVLYKNVEIKNVTITKIAFWNEGKDTINNSDIPVADPLTIRCKSEIKILDFNIIYSKNTSNQVKLSEIEKEKSIEINFDYLDFGDGAIIQILHSGNSSKDIDFSGSIKGVGKIVINSKRRINEQLNTIILLLSNSIMIFVAASIFHDYTKNPFSELLRNPLFYFKIIAMLTCIITPLFITFKRTTPKGFEVFETDS